MLNEHDFKKLTICPEQHLFLQENFKDEKSYLTDSFREEAIKFYLNALKKLIQANKEEIYIDWEGTRYLVSTINNSSQNKNSSECILKFAIIYFEKIVC